MTGTGITKIKKIENVGIFSSFAWPSPELTFSRVNLVYGYNGSGKTILSNILGLFLNDPIEDQELKRITQSLTRDAKEKIAVEIEWDGKSVKFPADKKTIPDKKKIYVFNFAFVTNHVYDGTRAKVKSFKRVVTKEQLSNPTLKKIVEDIKSEKEKKDATEGYDKKLDTLAIEIKKSLSNEWKKNIEGKHNFLRNTDLKKCPDKTPKETEDDLKKNLNDQFLKFKVFHKDNSSLENDITILNQISDVHLDLPIEMGEILKKSISNSAREKIKKKMDDLKHHALKHTTIQNWFDDGSNLLKLRKDEEICPLCDSQISNIEELINSYDAYFNDEFAGLVDYLKKAVNAIENALSKFEKIQEQANTIQDILSRYNYNDFLSQEEEESFNRILEQAIKNPLEGAKAVLQSKLNAVDFFPSEKEIEAIEDLFSKKIVFKEDIQTIVNVKNRILEKFKNDRFNQNSAQEICKNLFWKLFDTRGEAIVKEARTENKIDLSENMGGIKFFHLLKEIIKTADETIKGEEIKKSKELAKLKKESEYVNKFLSKMCINNFTINTENEGEITIHYSGVSTKQGIEYSLSEGEKTALAFAYFLSKYTHEVIDSQSEEPKDYIIVIDDPVSSLDENRLLSTALIIQERLLPKASSKENGKKITSNGTQQIFILSHNLIFLKFMSNLINPDQNSDRTDWLIDKGKISQLPEVLKNYQTSYFYKLSKIQAFVAREISYEIVKDYLPNYIRVTLEAFIAFKVARLKGEDRTERRPAMLGFLIGCLNKKIFLDKTFTPVADISDATTLQCALNEINHKVNPECHGTVQDITHIEYLSEAELKKLADRH